MSKSKLSRRPSARLLTEALERRQLMAVTLTNGLATSSPDFFTVVVDNGGSTSNTRFGASPGTSTVFDYSPYLDIGATAASLRGLGSAPVLGSDGVARSTGTVAIPGGGSVAFTIESSIAPGTKAFVNRYSFTSTGFDLRSARLFQYLDADIANVGDDVLRVTGAVSGSDPLILTTIDPATNIRQSQRNGLPGTNSSLSGFGADQYPELRSAISGGSYDAAPGGTIDTGSLPPSNVSGIGPVFGPNDITTALEYSFTSATTASLNTVLGIDFQQAVAPEIDVRGAGGVSILTGDTAPSATDGTDFGSAPVGSNDDQVFSIANLGNQTLNLTGSPRVAISGANAGDFTVVTQPGSTVGGGSSANFTIRFRPGATGLRTATVTIASNDSNEGSYTFSIQGNGTPSDQRSVVAANDAATTTTNTPVTINVLANDTSSAGAINPASVTIVSAPSRGTAVVNANGTVTYTPAAGAAGEGVVTFTYFVRSTSNPAVVSNTATVTVTVNRVAPPTSGPAIVSFTLVNADTEQDIMTIVEGQTLDLRTLPPRLNIRTNTTLRNGIGIVKFGYDAVSGAFNPNFQTEFGAPFALFGDFPTGNYNGRTLGLGAHTLTATASTYGGVTGASATLRFNVIRSSTGTVQARAVTAVSTSATHALSVGAGRDSARATVRDDVLDIFGDGMAIV